MSIHSLSDRRERNAVEDTAEFFRAFAKLEPADRRRLARLIETLADEQSKSQRPYTDRLMALRGTRAPRAGFRALLSEFSDY